MNTIESKTHEDIFDRLVATWGYSVHDKRHWAFKAKEYIAALSRYPVEILDLAIDWRRDHSELTNFPSIPELRRICEDILRPGAAEKALKDSEQHAREVEEFSQIIKEMGQWRKKPELQSIRDEAVEYLGGLFDDPENLGFLIQVKMAHIYRERNGG